MIGTDDAGAVLPPKHEPADVSAEMRKASPPASERITRPARDHVVDRIAKRTTTAEDGGAQM